MKIIENCSVEQIISNPKKYNNVLSGSENGVIFRNLWATEFIENLKKWVFDQRIKNGLSGDIKYSKETKNHFKLVDKAIESNRPTRFIGHQFFLWNKEQNSFYHDFFLDFIKVRNILNNEDIDLTITKTEKFVSWIAILQYRRGGDFLATHKDGYKFQSILMMSEKGKDFLTGGQYFLHDKNGHVFTENNFKKGDLLMLKANCYHGVHPIDPNIQLTNNSIEGRWIMFSPYLDKKIIENNL